MLLVKHTREKRSIDDAQGYEKDVDENLADGSKLTEPADFYQIGEDRKE
jgi:hypothetical protein